MSPTPPPHQEIPTPSPSAEPSSDAHETGQVRRTPTVRTDFVGSLLAQLASSAAASPSAADEKAASSAQWRQQWIQQNQRPPHPTNDDANEEEADTLCPPSSDA